ncbi:hypothetical protein [Streptomyces sp. NPDC085479]|uniref:hypothetical protein n=1 Tax=Streptomyces sp. NPDC085479 TaxID=3365726 RepID=UPI0037CCDF1E
MSTVLAPRVLRRLLPVSGAVAAVVALAAGCQADSRRICTLTDADSGVTVSWRPADFPVGARHVLCADGECRHRERLSATEPVAFLSVPLPEEKEGPRDVALRFTVTDPAEGGRVVYDRSTRVELRVFHPNGEGCGPAVRQGGARADPVRGLVSRD